MLTVSVILKLCVIFLNLRLKLYSQDPVKAFENGEFSTDVEILLGSNGEEGLIVTQFLMAFEAMFDGLIVNWNTWGPLLLFQKHVLEITAEDTAKAWRVLEFYCGTQNVTQEHMTNITQMFTDSLMRYSITKYIDDYHLQHSSKPVFQYINHYINEEHQVEAASTKKQFLRY